MEMNTSTKAAKDAYQGASRAADKAVDKIKSEATDFDLAARYEAIKESASEGYDTAISTVKKYPLYAIGGAAAVGLVAGFLLARRK